MPVGSCLGGQIDNNEANLEVIMTSSVLNQADQFAFMQQTLLMQVRDDDLRCEITICCRRRRRRVRKMTNFF